MAIADHRHHHHKSQSDTKLFRFCMFWQSGNTSSSSSSTQNLTHSNIRSLSGRHVEGPSNPKPPPKTVSSVARSLLPPRQRLRLDPSSNLYFPNEPRKQVKSAIRLKNTSRFHVAFKILGYGWAGMLRRYLVDPVEMSWPANLAQVSLFRLFLKLPMSTLKMLKPHHMEWMI
ncbi:vesicle-associated protein 4-1 isoform X1 [Quercus suber]|uniref:vesicle-associated protein 4-1 isoform X1 n=1 Tax=Quercus suber TaxID=58331 RepID=UPI000CE1D230|nr:vesicle-associated protein 4-1-like [Quercus suber]